MSTTHFEAYAPPQADLEGFPADANRRFAVRRAGDDLVVERGTTLPPVCLKCGSRTSLRRRRETFIWCTPWIWLSIVTGWVIFAILYLSLRKKVRLELPLCQRCTGRWNAARLARALALLWLLCAPVLAVLAGDVAASLVVAILLSMPLLPILLITLFVRSRIVRAVRINDREITLRGVAPGATHQILDLAVAGPTCQ